MADSSWSSFKKKWSWAARKFILCVCILGHAYVVPVAVAPVSSVVMKIDTKRSSDPIIRRAHISNGSLLPSVPLKTFCAKPMVTAGKKEQKKKTHDCACIHMHSVSAYKHDMESLQQKGT